MDDAVGILAIFGGLIFIIIMVCVMKVSVDEKIEQDSQKQEQKITEWDYAMQNNYTAYLDGTEIDMKTVDPNMYLVSFNHENQIVYLSKETKAVETTKKSTTIVPIVIP